MPKVQHISFLDPPRVEEDKAQKLVFSTGLS